MRSCQVSIQVNEIVCGDGVEVKLRVERFLGGIAFFASLVAILFVIFASYRTLFGVPRKGSADQAAFNRSKDQKVRLLAEKRNQRRFGVDPAAAPAAGAGTRAGVATGVTGVIAQAYAYDSDDDSDEDSDGGSLEDATGVPAAQPVERVSFRFPSLGSAPPAARGGAAVPAAFVVSPTGVPYSC